MATIIGEPRTGQSEQQTVVLDLSDDASELARFKEFYRLTCVSPNEKRIAVIHSYEDSVPFGSTSVIANSSEDAAPMRSVFQSNDLRVFDLASGTWMWTAGKTHNRIHAVAYTADGSAVLTIQEPEETDLAVDDDGLTAIEFQWWDAETGDSIRKLSGPRVTLLQSDKAWAGVAVNSDATRAALWKPGAHDSQVVVCDTTTGEVAHRLRQRNGFRVAAFSQDGTKLVTVGHVPRLATSQSDDGVHATTELKVWDLSAGTALLTKPFGTTSAIEFSPDDRCIILNEIDFSDPDVQSDLVVIDAESASELMRIRRIGYGPRSGFLSNNEIFATVASREIDGTQMNVLGKLFSWKIPDVRVPSPGEVNEAKGDK